MQGDLQANLNAVLSRMARAAERSGRDPAEIKLICVSKTQPADVLRRALNVGCDAFGENKVQEAESKIFAIGRDAVEWHLIGHLQSNKARRAVQLFDVVHALDSVALARRLERICEEEHRPKLSVFVQVDLAGEATKSGLAESDLPELTAFLQRCKCLSFDGLMVLPPFFQDAEIPRPYFERLRQIRDKLVSDGAFRRGRGELSMGMSHDFEVAIEEGATVIRVGTAIFGDRRVTRE
jgi:pyridoxal phosphate enzyme (YggS family)